MRVLLTQSASWNSSFFLTIWLIWIDLNVNYIVSMALGIFGAINGGLTLQQACLQH